MARKLRLSDFTAAMVIGDVQDIMQKYVEGDLTGLLWLTFINDAVREWNELSGNKNADDYYDTVILPIIKTLSTSNEANSSYDGDSGTLIVPLTGDVTWQNESEGFNSGWEGATGFITRTLTSKTTTLRERTSNVAKLTTSAAHELLVGDTVIISGVTGSEYNGTVTVIATPTTTSFTYASVAGNEASTADTGGTVSFPNVDYPVQIAAIIDATHVTLESTNNAEIPDISGSNLIVNLGTDNDIQKDLIDLTLYPKFKAIDTIIKMTALIATETGKKVVQCIGPPKVTAMTFEGQKYSHNYGKSIIWYKRGEVIECSKGVLVSYGTRQLHVHLNPEPVLTENDLIDVKNNDIPQIKKIVEIKAINALQRDNIKVAIPQDLLDWYNKLQASKASEAEKNAKK